VAPVQSSHKLLKSSGTSPNFRITLASPKNKSLLSYANVDKIMQSFAGIYRTRSAFPAEMNGGVGFAQQSILKRFKAFRCNPLHFFAQLLGAHNYPRSACRAKFTRAQGRQGSQTAARRATGAALDGRRTLVTKMSFGNDWRRAPVPFLHVAL
jgi:hypothetical protein